MYSTYLNYLKIYYKQKTQNTVLFTITLFFFYVSLPTDFTNFGVFQTFRIFKK